MANLHWARQQHLRSRRCLGLYPCFNVA